MNVYEIKLIKLEKGYCVEFPNNNNKLIGAESLVKCIKISKELIKLMYEGYLKNEDDPTLKLTRTRSIPMSKIVVYFEHF